MNTRRLAERVAHLLAERLGEGQRGGPPRQPVEGAPASPRGPAPRRRPGGAGGDGLARARHRHRARRAGLPDRLAPQHRDLAAAGRPLGPRPGRGRRRAGSTRPRATSSSRAPRSSAPCGAGSSTASCRPGRRSTSSRSRSWPRARPTPWPEDELFDLVRRAAPYAELARADFDAVVEPCCPTASRPAAGARAAYLHRDRVNGVLRGRRGARLAALTSGGAIPETADYRVVADPDDTMVGTVNEDWAIESMQGDVFLLGSTSWRIRRVEAGVVRVVDAAGRAADGAVLARRGAGAHRRGCRPRCRRSASAVGRAAGDRGHRVRRGVARRRGRARRPRRDRGRAVPRGRPRRPRRPPDPAPTSSSSASSTRRAGCSSSSTRRSAAGSTARSASRSASASAGAFDFELQAAASDDAVVLSLGPGQSFPLEDVPQFLTPENARGGARAGAARSRRCSRCGGAGTSAARSSCSASAAGAATPPPIQRMEADDLMAAVFPALAGCQENAARGADRDPGSPDRAPDDARLPARGDRCGRARRGCFDGFRSGAVAPVLPRDHRAVAAGARDPERPAVHLPRRRAARGAADARRRAPARPARDGARSRASSTPKRSRASATKRGPTAATPRSSTISCSSWSCSAPRRPARPGSRSWPERAGRAGAGRRRARSGWPPSSGRAWPPCFPARRSSRTCACRAGDRRDRGRRGGARGHASAATSRASGRARPPSWPRATGLPGGGDAGAARPARGGGLRCCGDASIPRDEGDDGVLRAAPPRPDPPLHDGPAAARDRARHRAGPGALPPALAARRAGHAARGPSGAPRRDRAAPGVRDRRGLLGAVACCRRASAATGPSGSTSSACRVRSRGRGSRSAARRPARPAKRRARGGADAVARDPRELPRCGKTCPWLLRRHAGRRRAGAARSPARRTTCSSACAREARSSSTISSRVTGRLSVEVDGGAVGPGRPRARHR